MNAKFDEVLNHYVLEREDGAVIILQKDEAYAVFHAYEREIRRADLMTILAEHATIVNEVGSFDYERPYNAVQLTDEAKVDLVNKALSGFHEAMDNLEFEEFSEIGRQELVYAYYEMLQEGKTTG